MVYIQVHAPARIKTDSVDAFMQETRATKRISMRIIQVGWWWRCFVAWLFCSLYPICIWENPEERCKLRYLLDQVE